MGDGPIAGFPMAKNLRAKIPAGDTMVVHDRNTEVTDKFVQEVGADIEVATTPRGVAEQCVSYVSIGISPVAFE